MDDDKSSPGENQSSLPTPPSVSDQELKPFSCILCKQRKIKCDKHYPCQNCTKAKVQCIFRAPAPPRRGKRKPAEVNLLARLKRYEDMLQGLGVSIEKLKIDDDGEKSDKSKDWHDRRSDIKMGDQKLPSSGKLIAEEGKSIYVEDNLWTSLSEEIPHLLGGSSEDEEENNLPIDRNAYEVNSAANQLLFNLGPMTPSLRIPHPPIEHVQRMWEIFTTNFNPLTKILHVPTVERLIFPALQEPSSIPKNVEALIYSIYCGALTTLDSSDTQALFGEDQPQMLTRFRMAAQQALIRAGLLRSADLMIVQAFTIYLLAVRLSIDPRSLWMLTGINKRLGDRIGLHRDGSYLSLSPFETEIRRRLWWQVHILDTHAAILSGSGGVLYHNQWDTKAPLNVNDSDIWPSMEAPPLEHEGPTEMFFCLLRHEFGKFFRQAKLMQGTYQSVMKLSLSEKQRKIDDVEKNIEQRFLRYCDPLSSLHHLAQGAGRGAVASMRLMANHPRHLPDKGASMSPAEKTALFLNALKIVEYDSMTYSDPRLKGYRWHVRAYFQYNAFVYMLQELCHRGTGDGVDRAWKQVSEVFRNHPEMRGQRALQIAVGRLVCKAWGVRAAALIQAGEQPVPPSGVDELLATRAQSEREQQTGPVGRGSVSVSASGSASEGPEPKGRLEQDAWTSLENVAAHAVGGADSVTAAWTGHPWMGSSEIPDEMFDFNNLQEGPTPMDWAAWDEILRDGQSTGGGMPYTGEGFSYTRSEIERNARSGGFGAL